MEKIIKINGLSFSYEEEIVLDNLELKVDDGSVFGLVGKNGSGKTTLLQIVLNNLQPDVGVIKICGYTHSQLPKGKISYVPERPYYHQEFKLKEYLRYLNRLDSEADINSLDQIIDLVALEDHKEEYLASFSKGMLQRVGVAQALLQQPEILILDEPMSGLDPAGQSLLRDIILDVNQAGVTVLLTSHNLGEVERLCDQIGVLHQGSINLIDQQVINSTQQYRAELKLKPEETKAKLEQILQISGVYLENNQLVFPANEEPYFQVMDYLAENKIKILELQTATNSLEDLVLDKFNGGDQVE